MQLNGHILTKTFNGFMVMLPKVIILYYGVKAFISTLCYYYIPASFPSAHDNNKLQLASPNSQLKRDRRTLVNNEVQHLTHLEKVSYMQRNERTIEGEDEIEEADRFLLQQINTLQSVLRSNGQRNKRQE